jgi:O-antigen/teichoic acid export membrane protein
MKIVDSKILRGATWVGIGNITSQILAFFFMVILARFYSTSDYGLIRYVIYVGTLAATIVAAGFPSALVRFIAKHRGKQEKIDEYFTNIFTITLGLLFAVVMGVTIIYKSNVGIISIVIGYSVVYIYLGVIRGFMHYKKIALFNVLRNLVKIVVLVILCYILLVRSPVFIVILYAFGGWIVILILEVANPTHVHYSPSLISRKTMKEVTTFSIPVMISMLAYTTLLSIPVIAIKSFYNYELVALYSAAMTLTILFSFIPTAIVTMTMPKISNVEDKKQRIKYTVRSLLLVLITGITLYIFIFFFGKLALEIIFTERYVPSYPILIVLSIGAIFAGLRDVFCALWEGSGHPIIATYDMASASAVCITSSFLLVPSIGPIGAAYGYSLGLITAVLVDLIYWIKYRYTGKLNLE